MFEQFKRYRKLIETTERTTHDFDPWETKSNAEQTLTFRIWRTEYQMKIIKTKRHLSYGYDENGNPQEFD